MSKLDKATINSLFELHKGGDFKTLAERARSLLVSHPDELVIHSLLGAACLELGEYDAAIRSYRAALALKPDFAKAHNSLGIAWLRLGRLEDAAGSFLNAVKRDPQFAEAWFNSGVVYENLQRWDTAADCYKKATIAAPDYYKAFSSLAKALWESGEHDEVAGHYEKALAVREDFLPAHGGLMRFLEQSNQHEKLRAAIARAGNVLGVGHVLVRLYEGVMVDIDGEREKARALLEGIHIEPTDVLAMHDERTRLARLTNICDKLDDTGAAMGYAEKMNRLSRQLGDRKGIDKEKFLGFVENRRRYFTRDNVKQWRADSSSPNKGVPRQAGAPPPLDQGETTVLPRRGKSGEIYKTEQPIFILGFPRSGTTLVDTILRGHPSIEVAEEIDAVPAMVNQLAGYSDERLSALASLSGSDIEGLKNTYFDALARHARPKDGPADGNARLIDRFALNIIYAGEIYRVFPDARFILVLRHPADCVLSCFMQAFYETSANANFHTLEDTAYLYDQVFSLWEQYVEALNPNALRVKYEDIITDLEKACRPILDFIRTPWRPGLLDHELTARNRPFIRTASYNQVTRPLYSEANGRWLRYRREMQSVLPMLEPWINHFNY